MEERYTDVRLVKVPIEIDNKNQLTFSSKASQYTYFNSCTHIELDDSSYQRKDSTIRYPGHIDDLIGYNYCMYKNTTYSNKWYYAFITDMRYISDSMTLITIKTDVWQTWQFDLEIKRSFVEREHVNDDTIGLHTLPEQIERGDYIIEAQSSSSNTSTCHVVIASTYDIVANLTDGSPNNGYHTYNGIPNGSFYYIVGTTTSYSFMTAAINNAAASGKSDGIVGIFLLPDTILGITASTTWDLLYLGEDGYYLHGTDRLHQYRTGSKRQSRWRGSLPYTRGTESSTDVKLCSSTIPQSQLQRSFRTICSSGTRDR